MALFRSGWQDQYQRMSRAYERGKAFGEGRGKAQPAEEALDFFFHFFQDGWHLKDWLKNDPESAPMAIDVEAFVDSTPCLALCADLANGSKHLELNRSRAGDLGTGIKSGAVVYEGEEMTASFTIEVGGATRDALDLAREVVDAWGQYLRDKGIDALARKGDGTLHIKLGDSATGHEVAHVERRCATCGRLLETADEGATWFCPDHSST